MLKRLCLVMLGTGYVIGMGGIVWAQPSPSPQPRPGEPSETINQRQAQELLYRFRRAQSDQRRALIHEHKSQAKQLKGAQEAQFKEWNQRENQSRREYFRSHSGPEKRSYMQDLKRRRSELQLKLKQERNQKANEREAESQKLKQNHEESLRQFRDYLSRNLRPPQTLWP